MKFDVLEYLKRKEEKRIEREFEKIERIEIEEYNNLIYRCIHEDAGDRL